MLRSPGVSSGRTQKHIPIYPFSIPQAYLPPTLLFTFPAFLPSWGIGLLCGFRHRLYHNTAHYSARPLPCPANRNYPTWPPAVYPLPVILTAAYIQRIRCALSYGYMRSAYLSIKTFAGSATLLGPYYVGTLYRPADHGIRPDVTYLPGLLKLRRRPRKLQKDLLGTCSC